MNYREYAKRLANGKKTGAYIFVGNGYIRQRAISSLKAMLDTGLVDMNFSVIENASAKEIKEACDMLPVFDAFRVVVARGAKAVSAGKDDADLKELCGYIADLPEEVCLIFDEDKVDKRKSGYKELVKAAELVEFDDPNDAGAARIVMQMAKEQGTEISKKDAAYMVALVGCDLFALQGEVKKLAGISDLIGKSDIDAYVTPCIDRNVFKMMDAFESGRSREGLKMLLQMESFGEPAVQIIGAIAYRFRMLLMAAEAVKEVGSKQAVSALGGGYAAKIAVSDSRKYSISVLRKNIKILLDADLSIKQGKQKDYVALSMAISAIYGCNIC